MSGKLYHRIKKVDGKWTWRPCLGELCLICDGHMDTRNDPIDLGEEE